MAVAVDDDRRAGLDGLPRALAAEVEVRRGAVDFERRPRFGRGRVDGRVVHVITVAAADELIGGMGNHGHEWMADRADAASRELGPRLARRVVKRGEHDVERLQHRVGTVERAVGQDVDLEPVQDRHIRRLLPKPGDFSALPREPIEGQRA